MIRLSDNEFEAVVSYMREHYGINLSKKKILIECRMTKVLERQGVRSFSRYLDLLWNDKSGKVADELVDQLTTNYTYFMRESEHFTILRDKIFPHELACCGRDYYIWCAGCSTGEECYSLAMALQEFRDASPPGRNAKIVATDISGEVLDTARTGRYPMKMLSGLPVAWQKKYCHIECDKHFSIDEQIRHHIRFQKNNLLEHAPYPEKFDMIFCRNVMIYFDRASKSKLIHKLEECLNPGGYLFVGHAELLSQNETELEPVYPAVYRRPASNEHKEFV